MTGLYQKILVPLDGSETAAAGLAHALRLGKDQAATLCLLHVVHDYLEQDGLRGTVRSDELLRALRARGERILSDAAARARAAGVTARADTIDMATGPVGEAIVEYLKVWPADLIVLGTHGRRGLRRLVLGSDAEYVVRTTPVPVLLIRGPTPD
jgi:nucleotide-binding universal stress UspA family protein